MQFLRSFGITVVLLAASIAAAPAPELTTINTTPLDSEYLALQKRDQCSSSFMASAADVITCMNSLYARGDERCGMSGPIGISFCVTNTVRISGSSPRTGHQVTSSCRHIAMGVQWVLDNCTHPNQQTGGEAAAYGNGDLTVYVRHVSYADGPL